MNVFVWEALSAGVDSDPSLRREGLAMLAVLCRDLVEVDGVTVTTLLAEECPALEGVRAEIAHDSPAEHDLFRRLAADAEHCWLIAPETGGLLADRIRLAEETGTPCCNCSADAVDICGDKLRLFEIVHERGIPVVPTFPATIEDWPRTVGYPCVIKPRDGAGSSGCQLLLSPRGESAADSNSVVQPFIDGIPVSTAAIVTDDEAIVFPAGRQIVDGLSLKYLGGVVPASLPEETADAIAGIVHACVTAVDGLCGYVGFDLVIPSETAQPMLLEINPRLTTAYAGYRQLAPENLAERILFPARFPDPIGWNTDRIQFGAVP